MLDLRLTNVGERHNAAQQDPWIVTREKGFGRNRTLTSRSAAEEYPYASAVHYTTDSPLELEPVNHNPLSPIKAGPATSVAAQHSDSTEEARARAGHPGMETWAPGTRDSGHKKQNASSIASSDRGCHSNSVRLSRTLSPACVLTSLPAVHCPSIVCSDLASLSTLGILPMTSVAKAWVAFDASPLPIRCVWPSPSRAVDTGACPTPQPNFKTEITESDLDDKSPYTGMAQRLRYHTQSQRSGTWYCVVRGRKAGVVSTLKAAAAMIKGVEDPFVIQAYDRKIAEEIFYDCWSRGHIVSEEGSAVGILVPN
ncbi:hypothetical protein NMY22_g19457 [Coprinellus aureogranulatus]|nr:hypothetical protein NMY22_g19457 [Coprinellus aureogranulatus]